MAEGAKPYRLYRGGRVKGRVPLERRTRPRGRPSRGAVAPQAPRRRRWALWVALGLGGFVVLFLLWGAFGYVSFRSGVEKANGRLPPGVRARLAKQHGSLLSNPTTILVIGTDGGTEPGRANARRSDSLLLVRSDPGKHRLFYLSIPRDLRVDIPGHGPSKINAASQIGGPALTLATVRALTGLPVNHVVVVDFDGFRKLIDALGGIDINIPKRILSNKFDCPYTRKRCVTWRGWRFRKGTQHMDGRRALVYSRIRTNRLDPSDTDISRAGRQQAVTQAVGAKLTSFGTFLRLPFIGSSIAAPVATDLSAWQLAQLGWVRFRTDTQQSLHCRLGGEPASIGGESVLLGSEDNLGVISMFLGRSAPLPPPKGTLYGAGCTRR